MNEFDEIIKQYNPVIIDAVIRRRKYWENLEKGIFPRESRFARSKSTPRPPLPPLLTL